MTNYKDKIIEKASKDFVRLEDGYLYYAPRKRYGAISSNALRIIADELDKRNKDWDEEVRQYFEKEI